MECPHLRESVKVNRDFIKSKKCELSTSSGNAGTTDPLNGGSSAGGAVQWKCLECTSEKENWMCLICGQVLCGRYENGHAFHHSLKTEHSVCLNTVNCMVYCYKCDDFVINGQHVLDSLRKELSNDPEYGSSDSTSTSSSSSDSGCSDEMVLNVVTAPVPSRLLRPRKRTNSNPSSSGSPIKKKLMRKVIGLRNLGNTCFMNSVLQSLNNIEEFSLYFNALPSLDTRSPQQQQRRVYYSRSQRDSVTDANMAEELRKVLINLNTGGDGSRAISPECLFMVIWRVVPRFRGHRQHDAHEFLLYMLNRLHHELQIVLGASLDAATPDDEQNHTSIDWFDDENITNEADATPRRRGSIVTNVFGGILQSEVRCLFCGMVSSKHDPFLDLSLDIPERFREKSEQEVRRDCHITDCLSSFTDIEELTETELYYCNSCQCRQKSTKRFCIRRPPNVLCLHVKRFRWNNIFRTKIDLDIKFPVESMDMSPYILNNDSRHSNSNVYDLAAVIVHHGNGSSYGHYTSYANKKGTWFHFNDQTVKKVELSTVAQCKPYILFYIRRGANNDP